MSSCYDAGKTRSLIPKKCPKCGSIKRKYVGDWPSQIVRCGKCNESLGYTK